MGTTAASHDPSQGHQHGGGHERAHHRFQAHHFETMSQQFDSAKLGMWLFLATEVLFFGGLFVVYAVLRARFPEVFKYASLYLDTQMGGINTCVLILSSLTMAMAVYFAQTNKKGPMLACLWLTLAGAFGFMIIKYFEYTHKIHEHLVWGPGFYVPSHDRAGEALSADLALHPDAEHQPADVVAAAVGEPTQVPVKAIQLAVAGPATEASAIAPAATGPRNLSFAVTEPSAAAEGDVIPAEDPTAHLADAQMPPNTHLFFAIYYAMTGLHGVHVVVGIFVISWLIWRGMKGHFNASYYTPVDLVGLYWHIVDLVWIFLFPLFYLID
ncbi:MAG: cytochrome c oxidase subunit 3 [Planctomycetota bacterium]|nr:cytochrome c oxidase subunit 3 [Planctomycetota bacterium]MDA1105667.1 cytochrome c oxidase subunit 3 [Planctomycetota bacterium]